MKEKKRIFLRISFILISTFFYSPIFSQNNENYVVVSYNVENLFDCDDDPVKMDDEFLPEGMKHWTKGRLREKQKKIAQVLNAVGGWKRPALVGLCEIENRLVLEELLNYGLTDYGIVHVESQDKRGIDVAFLYHKGIFKPEFYKNIAVENPNDSSFKTRDILYLKGSIEDEQWHFFMNHWPSKFGGVVETKPLRALAANTLRASFDSIMSSEPNAKIVAMGDFNDEAEDESVAKVFGAVRISDKVVSDSIYNLAYCWNPLKGTHKHQGEWSIIDQLFVSGACLLSKGLKVHSDKSDIYNPEYLLVSDEAYTGMKPNRTYIGYKYNGGFSDHMPIYLWIGR